MNTQNIRDNNDFNGVLIEISYYVKNIMNKMWKLSPISCDNEWKSIRRRNVTKMI